jgi:glycosyltransferase involved in cell wall biosynthesis
MLGKKLTDNTLRERLIAEAREHVLQFDWAEVARETVQVYDALVTSATRV